MSICYENYLDYKRVKKALVYIYVNLHKQPKVEEISAHVHLSKFHFSRIFKKWAGISPKKFLQYLTLNKLKKEINSVSSIQELSENIGLSSQSRVFDLFINYESVTPFEYKHKGLGIQIEYGIHPSPFGLCFIANTLRGICSLDFIDDEISKELILLNFYKKWKNADIIQNQQATQSLIHAIFYHKKATIKTLLYGTPFQIKVWEALLKIPFGKVVSYQHISDNIKNFKANRAVGSAIAKNNLAFIIPCHRVLKSTGEIGQYKWGANRKTTLIAWEKAKLIKNEK